MQDSKISAENQHHAASLEFTILFVTSMAIDVVISPRFHQKGRHNSKIQNPTNTALGEQHKDLPSCCSCGRFRGGLGKRSRIFLGYRNRTNFPTQEPHQNKHQHP